MNQEVYYPSPQNSGLGFIVVLLIAVALAGCKQTSAYDSKGVIVGVAQCNTQNSSAKEKAQLAAEANALRLLQLCHGGEFLIEVRDNGNIAATLQNDVELSGVNSSRIQGVEGYTFVMCDMPKAERIPDKYIKNTPEMLTLAGEADKVIRLILGHISDRGGRMLKEKGASRGRLYVEVRKPTFKINETPPTFRLELLTWTGD